MRLRNLESWVQFVNALDHCKGKVFLNSIYGDSYNLLSKLSQFLALNVIMNSSAGDVELICTDKDDEKSLREYFAA